MYEEGKEAVFWSTAEECAEKISWLLKNPVVTAPIIGPRTMEQLTGSLRALKIKFSKADLKMVDEIWPAVGEAPESYAW